MPHSVKYPMVIFDLGAGAALPLVRALAAPLNGPVCFAVSRARTVYE